MSCLALSLQPVNGGPDVLLQTREWFPPARALQASANFRQTREAYASGKRNVADGVDAGLGDEALAAFGGQVVVGKESKYRVFYRLVNSIYVLGITSTDQDDTVTNFFECTGMVNQAVSVLVTACKGVDVTADKLHRKYSEIYMALDVVLRGVSAARLATILATIHGEGIPQMVLSATDAENRARGAYSWTQVKGQSIEQFANIDALSTSTFELPEETIAAGDEVAASLAPAIPQSSQQVVEEKPPENEDPFAISDKINKAGELAGEFKKSKEPSDITAALADLEIPKVTASTTAESMFIGVEGFEGEYGGLDFGAEGAAFGGAFEGLDNAFGGGLDASEFGAVLEKPSAKILAGLGGLEELEGGKSGTSQAPVSGSGNTSRPEAISEKGKPALYLSEELHAQFKGSKLQRVGLQGSLYVKFTGGQDAAFSFRMDGSAGIRRAVMRSAAISSLGKGLFHVRASAAESPVAILRYRLHPRFTPLPLRIRLVTRQSGSLVSFMIQYVANPYLPAPLREVTFVVVLPFVPSLLKMSPKGSLKRHTKEIKWQVHEIPLQAAPGCLRAQMPLESDGRDANGDVPTEKLKLEARVEFSYQGQSLSGITIVPATEGNTDFSVGIHSFKTGNYMCS